jgi:hypothetical protein
MALVKALAREDLWKIHVSYMAKEHRVIMWKHRKTMDECGELLQKLSGVVKKRRKLFRTGGNVEVKAPHCQIYLSLFHFNCRLKNFLLLQN